MGAAATTLAGWKKAKNHLITCPSGTQVTITLPDIPALIEAGTIPNHLVEAAIGAVKGTTTIDRQFVIEQADFVNRIVALSVVEPKLTDADVKDVPVEDRELIAEIATRQRDLDALGHHIGGLHEDRDFRRFRGLDGLDAALEGL